MPPGAGQMWLDERRRLIPERRRGEIRQTRKGEIRRPLLASTFACVTGFLLTSSSSAARFLATASRPAIGGGEGGRHAAEQQEIVARGASRTFYNGGKSSLPPPLSSIHDVSLATPNGSRCRVQAMRLCCCCCCSLCIAPSVHDLFVHRVSDWNWVGGASGLPFIQSHKDDLHSDPKIISYCDVN